MRVLSLCALSAVALSLLSASSVSATDADCRAVGGFCGDVSRGNFNRLMCEGDDSLGQQIHSNVRCSRRGNMCCSTAESRAQVTSHQVAPAPSHPSRPTRPAAPSHAADDSACRAIGGFCGDRSRGGFNQLMCESEDASLGLQVHSEVHCPHTSDTCCSSAQSRSQAAPSHTSSSTSTSKPPPSNSPNAPSAPQHQTNAACAAVGGFCGDRSRGNFNQLMCESEDASLGLQVHSNVRCDEPSLSCCSTANSRQKAAAIRAKPGVRTPTKSARPPSRPTSATAMEGLEASEHEQFVPRYRRHGGVHVEVDVQ